MFKNKKAFLFDLDGTLVDSMGIWKKIDIEFLGRFNIALPPNLQKCIEGMSFMETAVYFKNTFGLDMTVDEIAGCWNEMARDEYINNVKLKKGAFDFVKKAHETGIKMAIASSNSHELVEHVLKARGIDGYMSQIVTACDVNKGKPAPDVYLHAAHLLDVMPSECVVFEDIEPGILAGKAAGMNVIAMEDAYSIADRPAKETLSDFYATDFYELMEFFDERKN